MVSKFQPFGQRLAQTSSDGTFGRRATPAGPSGGIISDQQSQYFTRLTRMDISQLMSLLSSLSGGPVDFFQQPNRNQLIQKILRLNNGSGLAPGSNFPSRGGFSASGSPAGVPPGTSDGPVSPTQLPSPAPTVQQELINSIFGERPELAFLGALKQQNLPQGLSNFFRGRTSDFLNRFQQSLGSELFQGNLPTQTAQDFFGGFNFRNEALKFSPARRGMGTNQFAPRTRFNF